MQIHEMHIRLEESIQKLSSNQNRYITPEQKDLHLNKHIEHFIDAQLKRTAPMQGREFQGNQLLLDSLGSLYVRGKRLQAYIDKGSPYKAVYSILPADYRNLIKDSSIVADSCKTTVNKVPSELHLCAFDIEATQEESYLTFEIWANQSKVFDARNYPMFEGITHKQERFLLYPIVEKQIGAYYERHGDVYKPRTFFLDSSTPFEVTINNGSEEPKTFESTITKLERYTKAETTQLKANRLYRGENLDMALRSPYEGTGLDSPVSQLVGNKLYIYEDSKFAVQEAYIDYIKKPKTVSYFFGIDCDLPESSQEHIVQMTAEYIAGVTGDQRYQILQDQNNKSIN